jgi:nucleoid DNA-binding protein
MRTTCSTRLKDSRESNFRPEFLNRIDDIIVFHTLTEEQIRLIVDMMLASVSGQLAEKEIKLTVSDAAKDILGKEGYREEYGARQLRRVIQNRVEDKLSEAVLREEFKKFDAVFSLQADIKKAEIIDAVLKEITELPDILAAEKTEEGIDVLSSKSVKFEAEKIIKEHLKEDKPKAQLKDGADYKITENTFVSYVVVDVKDDEIVIVSQDSYPLPEPADALTV